MATQKIYIGSIGPIIYDDTDLIDDPDGDFVGQTRQALVTSGRINLDETDPTSAVDPVLQGGAGSVTKLTFTKADEPADPAADQAVIWLSNGTGTGDAGDLMIKVNVTGSVKTGTIVDESGL